MKLLQPLNIGKMKLKNRVVMAPMGTTADGDGGYSARSIRYFAERAKGGVGLIITGRNASVLEYEGYSCSALANTHHVNRLSALADQVHAYGSKLCVQIGPGLGRLMWVSATEPPYSCSPIPSFWFPELTCKELSVEDIRFITEKVGISAKLAMNAGADAIEMHAYGSYLADQFMTEAFNHRSDQYGGSLENRVRFLGECIAAVQKSCGKDFPQIVKFTPVHIYDRPGYRKLEEGVEIAKLLEQWGAHALHVDTGCYEMWYRQIPTVYQEPGCQVFAAAAVRQAVNIPIITQGKLNDPALAEQVLQQGQADFIALGHQHIADPHYTKKVKEQRWDDIVPCIGCNECLRVGHLGRNYSCSVNPQAHHEDDFPLEKAASPQRVLVIGGGPGGMQAALTAAQRGMYVELWEQQDRLGGLLLAAGAPDFKRDVMNYVEYCQRQLVKWQVPVKLNTRATAENIAAAGFDRVILATGSTPFVPPIPGAELAQQAAAVLRGQVSTGQRCVVIGGGLVGCETALHLERQGRDVAVLEMLDDILLVGEESVNNHQSLVDMLKASRVNIITAATTQQISAGSVAYADKAGTTHELPADTVILAAGYRSLDELSAPLAELGIEADVIGDAEQPRKVVNATAEGFYAIWRM